MNHARRICLLLAVLFIITAVFGACEPRADVETDEATDSGGDKDNTKPNPYADDDTVYHAECFAGDSVYFYSVNAASGSIQLVLTLLDYPGEVYHACQDPTCYHSAVTGCPLADAAPFCIVTHEGELPVVYVRVGNEIRAFNSETGTTRTIGRTKLEGVTDAWFYRGKLYMFRDGLIFGRTGINTEVLDPTAKKSEFLETEDGAKMIGIWRDRVWYITSRNVICSCGLDFSDQREEYDIGVGEAMYRVNEHALRGYMDGGMIYFERRVREPAKFAGDAFINGESGFEFNMISDVYVLDADNIDAGERLVAEGVLQFEPHNGDLYYTKMDYDHYEESEPYIYTKFKGAEYASQVQGKTYRFDGGTLYRYEHESGKTVTVCEDCGTNFSIDDGGNGNFSNHGIIDITDEYVIFSGRQYRGLSDEVKDNDCCNHICLLDIKTGEWRVIVPSSFIPAEEIF